MVGHFFCESVSMLLDITNLEDTKKLAESFAKNAKIGDCFALYGDLGAGKSTFARYFIQYLLPNIENIPSPTFTIMQQYDNDILHVDCYRLESENEAIEIGLHEFFASSISLIEWPEKISRILPQDVKKLYFSLLDDKRTVEII